MTLPIPIFSCSLSRTPAGVCVDMMGRIFLAEWDSCRVFCITPKRFESDDGFEWHAATLIAGDVGSPAITMDEQGRLFGASATSVFCWTPIEEELAAPNFDCFRLGIASPSTPAASAYSKHLSSLETIAPAFCRSLGTEKAVSINLLPLLKRFGGDESSLDQFISCIENSEAFSSPSESPIFVEMLRDWIYGDLFPSLWDHGGRSIDSISAFARTLAPIFDKLGLSAQASFCADIIRCASNLYAGGLYENLRSRPPTSLSIAMLDLFKSQHGSNFVVCCSSPGSPSSVVSIACHSEILRARWPYFNALFESGLTEAREKVWKVSPWGTSAAGGLSARSVNDLLQYFYTDDVTHIVSVQTCVEILTMREYYMLDSASGGHSHLIQHCQYVKLSFSVPYLRTDEFNRPADLWSIGLGSHYPINSKMNDYLATILCPPASDDIVIPVKNKAMPPAVAAEAGSDLPGLAPSARCAAKGTRSAN